MGPVIEHKIGRGPYGAMALDADWRDAEWAARHGLYASVDGFHRGTGRRRRRRWRARSPRRTRRRWPRIKRTVWADTDHWAQLLDERAATSGTLVLSKFTRDAIAAFERR